MASYEDGYSSKYGYNKNAFQHKTLPQMAIGAVVKGITIPIGLASEAIHDYKDKKKAEKEGTTNQSEADGALPARTADESKAARANSQAALADGFDRDEADWELDDLTRDSNAIELEAGEVPVETLVDGIHRVNVRPARTDVGPRRLPFPVIVPQRRPGTKTRGFVRAYAPVLEDMGIDESMFLSFIENFHKASQSSQVLEVIVVAAAIAGCVPEPVIAASMQAVQVAVAIAQEVQERWRGNKFLEVANKEIFIPRGLFAMLVSYKPSKTGQLEVGTQTVDLGAQAVAKYGAPLLRDDEADTEGNDLSTTERMKEKAQRLRLVSGKTNGEAEMPIECAPLIFPEIEKAAVEAKKEGKSDKIVALQSKSKNASLWMGDYFDRRAQAKFAFENPETTLANANTQDVKFKSKFADPNNAVNTHLFTLLTGGLIKAQPLGARRRWEQAQEKELEARSKGLKIKASKRMAGENVLYLQIVNMPTEAELAKARQDLKEMADRKKLA